MPLNAIWNETLADSILKPPNKLIPFWLKQDYIPPLQPLLIWQSISLFWLCGLLAARFPIMGIAIAFGILLIDKRIRHKARTFAAICLFIIGFLAIHFLIPMRPTYPTWAMQEQSPISTRLEGTVTKVESLSDQRLRIFLRDVRSLKYPKTPPLPGLLVWTWDAKKSKENKYNSNTLPIRPLPGQKVHITAKLRTTKSFKNLGSYSFGFYWQSQGVFWRIWSRGAYGNPQILEQANIFAQLRNKALHALEQTIFTSPLDVNTTQTQAKAFLPALLFGEKYYLTQDSMENMRAASLIHSLALSGQHLALVVFFAAIIASFIHRVFPKSLLILPKRKWIGLIALPLAALYLWIGNAPPSLLRAAIMLTLALILYWRTRVATLVDVLLMTLLLITCYNPTAIFNLGLQLSVLCVASIAIILPLLRRIPKPNIKLLATHTLTFYTLKLVRNICQIFIISLAIQIVLLPIFIYYFPPSGPWFITNIVWLPVLGIWVLPLAAFGLVAACIWPSSIFAEQILTLAAWPCELLLNILQYMHQHGLFNFPALLRPHGTVFLAWIALCLALALLVGRVQLKSCLHDLNKNTKQFDANKTLLIIGMIFLFAGPIIRYASYHSHDVHIDMLDVGQGQAICITSHGGQRILIDGGGSYSSRFDIGYSIVMPTLIDNAAPHLLAVINTHPDMDHLQGLMSILKNMQVGKFYHNGKKMRPTYIRKLKSLQNEGKLPPTEILHSGMQIPLSSVNSALKLHIIHPPKDNNLSSNNASIVLHLVHEDKLIKQGIAIFCGDAEILAQKMILQSKQDIEASIISVPHHGSKDALLKAFYDSVKPQIALVSTAQHNNLSLPHFTVQNALKQKNIRMYSTASKGGIRVTWRSNAQIYKLQGKIAPPTLQVKTLHNIPRFALIDFLR